MCHRFDQRQLGPAGWAAFTSMSLTPSEFREMAKRYNTSIINCTSTNTNTIIGHSI